MSALFWLGECFDLLLLYCCCIVIFKYYMVLISFYKYHPVRSLKSSMGSFFFFFLSFIYFLSSRAIGRFHHKLIHLLPILYKRRNGLNVNNGFQMRLQSLEKYVHGEYSVERGQGRRRSPDGTTPIVAMFNSGGASRF